MIRLKHKNNDKNQSIRVKQGCSEAVIVFRSRNAVQKQKSIKTTETQEYNNLSKNNVCN